MAIPVKVKKTTPNATTKPLVLRPCDARRPAFFLGISGKMNLPGYDPSGTHKDLNKACAQIYERVGAVLDWLRSKEGLLDRNAGTFDGNAQGAGAAVERPWRAVGLQETPIVVLTSLAPGADTLAAEAALKYQADHRAEGCRVSVRAVLPFPLDVYKQASTFVRGDSEADQARVARLESVVEAIRGQDGFVEDRDLFCVQLHASRDGDPVDDLSATDANGRPRRHLRYRAAGEAVATHSHLLLAIYDELNTKPSVDPFDLYASGTPDIVEAKRRGPSFGLLALSNSFSWADNGPVLRIPIDENGDGTQPCDRAMALLHPYDLRPVSPSDSISCSRRVAEALSVRVPDKDRRFDEPRCGLDDSDPAWQSAGDALFRNICALQEEFNKLEVATKDNQETESDEGADLLGIDPNTTDHDEREILAASEPLADLAAVRRRAATNSGNKDGQRDRLMRRLASLIFAGALLLGAFEHSSTLPSSTGVPGGGFVARWWTTSPGRVVEGLLLLAALACMVVAGWVYWRYRGSLAEDQRFDHRAIGEGLRVQFYWSLCGVQASAAAEYMQRQRGELSWIRYVIGAMFFPMERWKKQWERHDAVQRAELLERVRMHWVRGQRDYARRKARKSAGALHFWQHWGWTLAAAGILNVFALLVCEVSPGVAVAVRASAGPIAGAAVAMGLLCLVAHLILLWCHGGDPHDELYAPIQRLPDGHSARRMFAFARWIFARPLAWGWALLIASGVFWTASRFPTTSSVPLIRSASVWLTLTGTLFLAGAMCLAWSERNFHAEHARQNQALLDMYACADRRLEELIARYKQDGKKDSPILVQIQDMLCALGREALEENAEWLILHRTRPLEPFLA